MKKDIRNIKKIIERNNETRSEIINKDDYIRQENETIEDFIEKCKRIINQLEYEVEDEVKTYYNLYITFFGAGISFAWLLQGIKEFECLSVCLGLGLIVVTVIAIGVYLFRNQSIEKRNRMRRFIIEDIRITMEKERGLEIKQEKMIVS